MCGIEFDVNSAFSASEKQHRMGNKKLLLLASSAIFSGIQYDIMSTARKETNKEQYIKLQSRYLCFCVFISIQYKYLFSIYVGNVYWQFNLKNHFPSTPFSNLNSSPPFSNRIDITENTMEFIKLTK